ncbi:MAG: hypothetical protein DME19_03815 [Verrucomicrobia bacterium]|nr:MAG: hypothetical protein DME19_03815 [Verrucomicrobiota bacterium]
MKKINLLSVALGLCLFIPRAPAQILSGSTNIADQVGQVILPDRILLESTATPPTATRPPRPERPDLPLEIRQRLNRFEKLRETYLARQQELLRKLHGATDEDRVRIRGQLRALSDEWLEKARSFRQEAKDRMKDVLQLELSGRSKIFEDIPKPSKGRHPGSND